MPPHVILTDTTLDDIFAWLPDLVTQAHQELALHPLRPQPHTMLPYRVPMHELFNFARHLATWYVGVYEALPDASPPFGAPLMLIAGNLRDTASTPGELTLGLWCSRRFPLDLTEIAWLLEDHFPSRPAPASPLAPFLRPGDLKGAERTRHRTDADPIAHRPPPIDAPPPSAVLAAGRRAAGAMLPSTAWLVEQLTAQPDVFDAEPLYQEWMKRYQAHTGLYPRDSARSFEKALDSAFKHVGRTRRRRPLE